MTNFAQDKIYDIEFHFEHSRRIPNHTIDVKISRQGDKVTLNVSTKSSKDEEKWTTENRCKTFPISLDQFQVLITSARNISCNDMVKNIGKTGLDGTVCELMFGDYASSITYKIWYPSYNTAERNLTDFLNCCHLILKTAGLQPELID